LFPLIAIPLIYWRYTQKVSWNRKDQKNAIVLAGGGASRRDSGVWRVDDYRGNYETVGRIEKPDFSPGFRLCGFHSLHANAFT